MADVCEFALFGLARSHRLGGMEALQSLHPGLLVRTDDMDALSEEGRRLGVEIANGLHPAGKVRVVFRPIEPLSDPVRLQVGPILKNAKPIGGRST
jgi:hypothetical protein